MDSNNINILILISLPFILVGFGVIFNVWSGFFVTRVKPEILPVYNFYMDKICFRSPVIMLFLSCTISLICIIYYFNATYIDIIVTCVFWLCFLCLRFVNNRFILLQQLAWDEYIYFPDAVNKNHPNRYRFYYPLPNISDQELKKTASNRDSEMVYLYKIIQKYNSWVNLREEIKGKLFHRGRRFVLYRTTGQISNPKVCDSWRQYNVVGLTPDIIWVELKSIKSIHEFAQRWQFYAILVSRRTTEISTNVLFSFITHIILFIFAFLVFHNFSLNINNFQHLLQSLLFSVSFMCSVVFSGVALMLFIYGKVIALDNFYSPIGKMGDQFFEAMSHSALVLTLSTAIAVGGGIPLSLLNNANLALLCAGIAGIFTAGIYFIAVWGTHFSMENTKKRAMEEVVFKLKKASKPTEIEWLKFRYNEIAGISVWPVNLVISLNVFFIIIMPLILQIMLFMVGKWLP